MTRTPSDNHIRNLLDPVPPGTVFPVFSYAVDALQESGHLESYRSINGDLLMAMDGTEYFSSSKIHCDQCSVTEHKNGSITYSHTVVTPVIVAPGNPRVIPLEPEFVTPQDGHEKQDCENAAAKRWLSVYGARYSALGVTVLGDDLYCKQPLCEAFIREGLNFILVCKPDSHKTLYEWWRDWRPPAVCKRARSNADGANAAIPIPTASSIRCLCATARAPSMSTGAS